MLQERRRSEREQKRETRARPVQQQHHQQQHDFEPFWHWRARVQGTSLRALEIFDWIAAILGAIVRCQIGEVKVRSMARQGLASRTAGSVEGSRVRWIMDSWGVGCLPVFQSH